MLLSRYQLAGVLAQGAQSRVLSAVEESTGTRCIVKVGSACREEALLCLELNHPYIVQPTDCGVDAEHGPFAVYPHVSGRQLSEVCRNDPERFQRAAFQIADFLAFLHHRGWLYNDFKPEHFLVGEKNVHVLDLGLCSPISKAGLSTYSGTFPYISPERLLGRPHDGRSDLYEFGLLLLGAFFPEKVPAVDPSINALLSFQELSKRLRGKWRDLVMDLTAWEPNQRPGTAGEVWRRLVKPAAAKTILFFPLPFYRTLDPQILSEMRIHLFSSPSSLNLAMLERQVMCAGWTAGAQVFVREIRPGTMQQALCEVCRDVCREDSADIYDAARRMSKKSSQPEMWIILNLAGTLDAREESLLAFFLTSLQTTCYRFFVLSTQPRKLLIENSRNWDLPALDCSAREKIFSQILDGDEATANSIGSSKRSFTQPEHIYTAFGERLKDIPEDWWPAAARICRRLPPPSLRLTPGERRLISALEIGGGNVCKTHLSALRPGNLLRGLEERGYIRSEGDKYILIFPSAGRALKSLRKKQIREIAKCLCAQRCPDCTDEFRYRVARRAGELGVAAEAAMRAAQRRSGNSADDWLCRAFLSGADMSIQAVLHLAHRLVMRSRMHSTPQLLKEAKARFGGSFRLADLYLDHLYRRSALRPGIRLAEKLITRADKQCNARAVAYFTMRCASFHVVRGDLDRAEELLSKVHDCVQQFAGHLGGIWKHYRGLAFMLRGNLSAAREALQASSSIGHRFHASSMMTLGMVYMQQCDLVEAERCFRDAERDFVCNHDTEGLAQVHAHLGIVLKREGKLRDARQAYYKAIHLSRACGYPRMEAATFANLGLTYAAEGRTKLAIEISRIAVRVARKAGLPDITAACLNNIGLQQALRGRLQNALLSLTRSLKIRKKLGNKLGIAFSYEYLGFTYWMARKPGKARGYFALAERFFDESSSGPDSYRSALFLELCEGTPADDVTPDGCGDFEFGLHHYMSATKELHSNAAISAACLEHIHEAEIRFRKAPALYWLGKTLQLKAEYHARTGQEERAWLAYLTSHNIFTRLGARQELVGFTEASKQMNIPGNFLDRMAEKLPYRMLQLIRSVLAEGNPDRVIRRILDASLEFTGMERAVLLLQEDPPRVFMSTSIDEDTIRDYAQISASATETVSESRKPFIETDAESNEFLNQRPSVIRNRIVSLACLPLQVQDHLLGYLYLDSREGVETLATTESTLLDIFASVVALILNNSMILERSLEDNNSMRVSLGLKEEFPEIIGTSAPMLELLKVIRQLLDSDIPVLITGETGTGKELIARMLHYCGKRREGPFVVVNSAALPEGLLESEIFGHEKGSFTGATQTHKGLLEEAQGGTLFLDEIGDMPLNMQAKFLRALQDGEFRRVGGTQMLHTNARVVLATNRNLQIMVEDNKFREDLYYRVVGAQVHVPSLRERKDDIPVLAAHFLRTAAGTTRKTVRGISPEAMDLLKRYPWPGNVRQLKSEIERIVTLVDHEWVLNSDVSQVLTNVVLTNAESVAPSLREVERDAILQRLRSLDWNVQLTARSLGLTRSGLYSKMKLYGISKTATP